jgi:cold shock CspA family protein
LDEAIDMLSDLARRAEGREYRVAVTKLMDARRRRAERTEVEQLRPAVALRDCLAACTLGDEAICQGIVDRRLEDAFSAALASALRSASAIPDPREHIAEMSALDDIIYRYWARLGSGTDTEFLLVYVRRLLARPGGPELLRQAVTVVSEDLCHDTARRVDTETYRGTIIRYDPKKKYGFIMVEDKSVFFHLSGLARSVDEILISPGCPASCVIVTTVKGPEAREVRLQLDADAFSDALLGRLGTVIAQEEGKCVVMDAASGCTMLVRPFSLRTMSDWCRMQLSVKVSYNVDMLSRGGLRPVVGSMCIVA